jgi:hypothetical protein
MEHNSFSAVNYLQLANPLFIWCFENLHCLDFSFVFSAALPAWRNLFSASTIFCGGRYQPGCSGIFWPAKVPASLSLFLKSEKIPALLSLGQGPECKPFPNFRPVPSAYRPRAQISNHGRACTQALFLYIKSSFKVCSVFGATPTEHKDPWVIWIKETPADTVSIFFATRYHGKKIN